VPIGGFSGLLCLDVINSPVFFMGATVFSTNCRFTWTLPDLRPYIPPAALPGLRFQALTVDALFNGGFTNIAQ